MDEMIEQVAPAKVTLDDLDDLINALSPDELKELSLVDPDDSSMPANMRCIYDCGKDGTNKMDREKMVQQLKEEALATPDIKDIVEFTPGTIRGKKYVPKEEDVVVKRDSGDSSDSDSEDDQPPPGARTPEEEATEREYKEVLEAATLSDLIEIADILGVTYQDHCTATKLKVFPREQPNDTDINKVIEQVEGNSGDCLEINLNNIQGIPQTIWIKFFEALGNNSTVELLTATNCDLTDTVGSAVASCLERNKSLKYLTLDSNNISGDMLVKIIRSTAQSKVLEELRCSNQLNCKYLGHRIEKEIADALSLTPQLVKLGVTMEFRDSLNRTAVQLQKNLDKRRLTEDRTFTLKLDKKLGPSIVEEKSKM